MNQFKPMKILILEDNEYECNRYRNCIRERSDIELVATTNSCEEATKYAKYNNIDGIIVDIELHNGKGGTGFTFLEKLNSLELNLKPIIIVSTNILSERVHRIARDFGIDMIFCKAQTDYSPGLVFDTFILLRKTLKYDTPKNEINKTMLKNQEDHKDWISNKINAELDLISMSHKLNGRQYIFEAVCYILENKTNDKYFLTYLMKEHKTGNTNILNAMQTAINYAWKNTPPDDLEKYYTTKVSYERGVPTPTEFVHYYVDKINKIIS